VLRRDPCVGTLQWDEANRRQNGCSSMQSDHNISEWLQIQFHDHFAVIIRTNSVRHNIHVSSNRPNHLSLISLFAFVFLCFRFMFRCLYVVICCHSSSLLFFFIFDVHYMSYSSCQHSQGRCKCMFCVFAPSVFLSVCQFGRNERRGRWREGYHDHPSVAVMRSVMWRHVPVRIKLGRRHWSFDERRL